MGNINTLRTETLKAIKAKLNVKQARQVFQRVWQVMHATEEEDIELRKPIWLLEKELDTLEYILLELEDYPEHLEDFTAVNTDPNIGEEDILIEDAELHEDYKNLIEELHNLLMITTSPVATIITIKVGDTNWNNKFKDKDPINIIELVNNIIKDYYIIYAYNLIIQKAVALHTPNSWLLDIVNYLKMDLRFFQYPIFRASEEFFEYAGSETTNIYDAEGNQKLMTSLGHIIRGSIQTLMDMNTDADGEYVDEYIDVDRIREVYTATMSGEIAARSVMLSNVFMRINNLLKRSMTSFYKDEKPNKHINTLEDLLCILLGYGLGGYISGIEEVNNRTISLNSGSHSVEIYTSDLKKTATLLGLDIDQELADHLPPTSDKPINYHVDKNIEYKDIEGEGWD